MINYQLEMCYRAIVETKVSSRSRDANPIQSMAIIDYRLSYFLSIGLSIGSSNILSIGLSIGLSNILSIGLLSMSFHRFFSIISDLLVD